jgi:DNA-binding transcriptional regulator YdaS (Cro superfamily)
MIKRTMLEIYAYSKYGSMKEFANFIGITPVTLWQWIVKRKRPSKRNAQYVEKITDGVITEEYLRDRMD